MLLMKTDDKGTGSLAAKQCQVQEMATNAEQHGDDELVIKNSHLSDHYGIESVIEIKR